MPRSRRGGPDEFREWWSVFRDVLAFVGGLAILGFETVMERADRPWLIAAGLAMLGTPFAAAADRWIRRGADPTSGGVDSSDDKSEA